MSRFLPLVILLIIAGCAQPVAAPAESAGTTAETAAPTAATTPTIAVAQTESVISQSEATTDSVTVSKVEIMVRGEPISFYVSNATTPELTELVKRAVKIIADLDENYNEAVKEIRFGYSKYTDDPEGIWSTVKGGYVPVKDFVTVFQKGWTFGFVGCITVFKQEDDGTLPIEVYAGFEEMNHHLEICVEFAKEDGEWFVNNVYDTTG